MTAKQRDSSKKPRTRHVFVWVLVLMTVAGLWIADRGISPAGPKDSAWVKKTSTFSRNLVVNGHNIRLLEIGSGEPVLLLHGWADSTYTWRQLISRLKNRFRLVAFDWPGFGFSDKCNMPLSYFELAAVAASVMDALSVRSAFVVGNSMGGAAALQLAADYPERVKALALLDPAAGMNESDGPWIKRIVLAPASGRISTFLMGRLAFKIGLESAVFRDDLVSDKVVEEMYLPLMSRGGRSAMVKQLNEIMERPVTMNVIRRVSAPTLLIWGARDAWVPLDCAKRLSSWLKGSILKIIPNCGHLPQWEAPDETAGAIKGFFSRFQGPAGTGSAAERL
ncbi:MAG: alpha/beta hydrolase [Deltaproteobacteria bacterium]|nr:alpha/beta hydrolase [Deltaproteobacteria bacterium]